MAVGGAIGRGRGHSQSGILPGPAESQEAWGAAPQAGRPPGRRGGSAGGGGDVQVVRVLDGGRVVLRHLDGHVAGDV